MNEKRQQAYINLIQDLLNCPIGKESEILAANRDLLDVGFLQTVEAQAEIALQQGDENTANWLRYLAIQMPDSQKNLQTYIQLLGAVLGAIQDSEGDAQVVYPILTANLDKLNDNFVQILQSWAKSRLYKVMRKEETQAIAKFIADLSHLIEEFPLGSKSNTIEIAIAGYEIASTIFKDHKTIKAWAFIQKFLANVYRERILGNRADNLEKAIAFLEAALEVFTRETDPEQWANTQHVLGATYYDRIQGQKAKNLKKAVSYDRAALQVFTREKFPEEWAQNQHNLGVVHNHEEMPEEKAQNIEIAIAHFQAALQVFTRKDFPDRWANTHNDLGNSYLKRVYGERVQNLEAALISYESALQVFTPKESPNQWAIAQDNLAYIYYQKSRWESLDNLEMAINCYHSALQVYSHEVFPEKWAKTLFLLGIAYLERIRGNEAENVEMAIACYKNALQVHTREVFPDEWAKIQHELGLAYHNKILGEKAKNMELSIAYSQAALEINTYEISADSWAGTQNNLGLAYSKRILGDKTENLKAAIACYQNALKDYTREAFPERWAGIQGNLANVYEELGDIETALQHSKLALEVYTPKSFPVKCLLVGRNLGDCAFANQKWEVAVQGYQQAIGAIENSREWANNDTTRKDIMENTIYVYAKMIQACLNIGDLVKAIETAELSKTRNLVELILNRDLQTFYPSEVASKLDKLQNKINVLQYHINNGKEENPTFLVQHLQNLRQQYKELQDGYLFVGNGFNLDLFQRTLDEHTAVIEWYSTSTSLETFIITHKTVQRLKSSTLDDKLQAFVDWVNKYLQAYYKNKTEWIHSLKSRLACLSKILQIEDILKLIPKTCSRLVLIPHRYLHLFPLHALPLTNSELLCEKFSNGVSYAPSCQILQQVQQRKRPDFQNLFAIQNPTGDLNYTDLEVQVIQSYFNTANILKKSAATLTAVNNSDFNSYHCAHFSCHGYFNLTNPSKSALILADALIADTPTESDSERYLNFREGKTHDLAKCLTLDKIFSLKLEKCRLVTLSACETGLIDFNNTSDEYIGLPSGFLLAGSPSVVSSLWKVDDLSTSFLMIKFYENLIKLDNLEAENIAMSLNQAQQWLRNLNIEELDKFLEQHKPQIEQTLAPLRKGQRLRFQESLKLIKQRQPLPFANPYYWAGFTASGR
ncbi:MAG: CHAT domain-containing protein [Scytonema hyalinum WJT4-NPBG1]|jgi:CHAT domain-containing protein|nr:CHAT domain-containing protein [Scytonema hyalinum WJT4-NPBG1]